MPSAVVALKGRFSLLHKDLKRRTRILWHWGGIRHRKTHHALPELTIIVEVNAHFFDNACSRDG